MSVSSIGSAPPPIPAAPSPALRSVGGDYTKPNAATAQVKDSDGDYKPATTSPAASSSSAVQTALAALKPGGE